MSLHAILEAIRQAGEARAFEIENRAFQQSGEIIRNARVDAERIQEQACASELEPASKERARILHRARLEALQISGGARNGLVDKALEQAHGRLREIRTDAVYPRVLKCLLVEALSELGGENPEEQRNQPAPAACLEADARDHELLESLLLELGLDLPVSYTLECWGGLVARSEDRRIVAINTLEARLEKSKPYLRRYLAALFEDERSPARQDQALVWKIAYEPEQSG
jgi:V/A-type H+-transporting ATPase subunit E